MELVNSENGIVISGISGRFSGASGIEELWDRLCKGEKLYGKEDIIYPKVFQNIPKARGSIKESYKFDHDFFGLTQEEANLIDGQVRLLYEVTYEAFYDAGILPNEWAESRTGVFIGSFVDDTDLTSRPTPIVQSIPTRLSYQFNLRGPSIRVDTACASSLTALQLAKLSLESGDCDQAIVAGLCLHQRTFLNPHFCDFGILSKRGLSSPLDRDADGYVRSEAIISMIIQRRVSAKRIYAQVIGMKSNTDGYTKEGVTFPSRYAQKLAMVGALKEGKVAPEDINYIEAHLTGTQAGDKTECLSILDAYRPQQQEPIYVGALKSNLGHTEAAAGLASLTKALLILQNQLIPPMIPPNEYNPEIEPLVDGKIVPVTNQKSFRDNLIAVNAFGFGGANVHVILKGNEKTEATWLKSRERLFLLANRTETGIKKTFELLERDKESRSNEFLSLLDHLSCSKPESGMNYRAYGIINPNESIETKVFKQIRETKRLGLIVLSPLIGLPSGLSSISEFNGCLNRAKACNELALTISIVEFLLFLDLNLDFVLAFDPAITMLSARLKSLNQTVNDLASHTNGRKVPVDSSDLFNKLKRYFKVESGPTVERATEEDAAVWCSNRFETTTDCPIEDTFFLVIDGHIRLTHGLKFMQNHSHSSESIWKIIGELYLIGQNLKIEKIYPQIDYPVHRKCPSSSQLIQWDHRSDFDNNLYPEYYLPSNQTIQHIDLFDPEYANISDHIIDGRVIMPAAGFIYLIGKHLGSLYFDYPLKVGQFSYKLWDVKFIEACSMNEEVDVIIEHDPITFKFVIRSSESIFVVGSASIESVSRPGTNFEPNLRPDSSQDDDELKQSDIYQNGRVRGYHFGQKYKNVIQCKASRSTGYVKYSGDWIAFLDALIQIDQFWEKSRLLKVPTSIKSFSFDCGHFNRALDELRDAGGNHSLMVSSPAYGYIKTFGFSLDGLGWTAIKRRDTVQPSLAFNEFRSYLNNSLSLDAKQTSERREYHESCLSLLRGCDSDLNTSQETNKSLFRLLISMKNSQKALSDLIDQESQHLWNDILTAWPDEALNSVFDVVLSNTIKSDVIKIGYHGLLLKSLRDNMIKQSEKHRKFAEFYDVVREPAKDFDLILWTDSSSRLLPRNDDDKDVESLLKKHEGLRQNFVLVQSRTDLSQVERKILSRSTDFVNQKNKKFDFEKFGYAKVAESFVKESSMKFDLYRKKLNTTGLDIRQLIIVDDDYGWVDKIKHHLNNNVDRLWLVSTELKSGIFGLFNCLRLEPMGKRLRCLYRVGGKNYPDGSSELQELMEKDLTMNIYKNGTWGYMALQDIEVEKENKIMSDHYYCTFERAGMLETLRWTENYSKTFCTSDKLIKVAYAAINFRDTLIASGVVPIEAYPKENCFDLGLEFSGVTPDGKRVMGVVFSKGFASYIPIDSVGFMFMVPENWSLREAATVPVCYISAYYSLIVRGGLKPGESVLIHSGSGGVGLAAISIALNLGCRIFTTVSSPEKRRAVISMFPQLDESSSFADSRSTSFEDHILIHTNGRGVDIVLNSLTDNLLNAGIRCLAPGGRFIDLSKKDFVQDSPFETFQLEDNKTFETVCLVYLLTSIESHSRSKGALKMIEKLLEVGFQTGQIVPLPSQVYDKRSIEKAFRVMRKSLHIGKLLIKMNEIDENLNFQIEPLLIKRQTYFYPDKSYLIVGGLGGMGIELIRWMVMRGAKKIVISSRSGLKTGFQRSSLKNARELTDNQATIVIVRFDLTNFRGSARAIRETARLGPIGGIFNLAAVLKDNLFENQTKETFEAVCDPKIRITRNLDQVSRNECPALDYFVCFSSIAVQGNLGQSNYAYANSFIESICEARKGDGLPALAIEWGPIADVGLAARTFGDKQALSNYNNQSVDSFLVTLDIFLGLGHPICYSAIPTIEKSTRSSDAFTKVARIMGLKDIGSVDHNKTLRELGIDSVQAIEIQIYLSQEFKQSVKQFTIAELTLNDLKTMGQPTSAHGKGEKQIIKERLLVPLNGAVGNTIFFFPPAVADFLSMMPLAEALDCQVVGINYTDEALAIEQFDRLTELYYHEIMKEYPDQSEYFFVAYSFGVPIAFDLARKIQTRLGAGRIRRMIFIDTSPVGQQQSYKFFKRLRESGNFNWATMKDPRLSMDRKRTIQNDRLKIISTLEKITGDSGEKNAEIFFGFWDKMASIIELTFEQKFNGKVLHYQANEQPSALLDNLNSDLEKAIIGEVETRFIKSNHFEIINDGKDEILAGIRENLPRWS